jgi:tetratricopeptide (TPR) repeat protein
MAMDTAQAETSIFAAASRRRSPGQLWQVPTFLLGLVALAAVWTTRPLQSAHGPDQALEDLAALRQALDQPLTDAADLLTRARPVKAQLDLLGERQGEAHYLLGRVCLKQISPLAGDSALPIWQVARDHLDQAEALGVPLADQPRLLYLLASAWHHCGAEPQRVIAALNRCVELPGNDRLEGYGMLAEAYLRLPQPDLKAALEANQKQLSSPTVDDQVLVRPRLLRAELLTRLKQPEEARQVLRNLLERSGPTAPPELRYKATLMLAESLHQERDWKEALPLWELLQAEPKLADGHLARILYNLGLCYRQAGRLREAMAAWERVRPYGGDYAQASALGLADLRVQADTPAAAIEAFAWVVNKIASPADYHNTLIDLATARTTFEHCCQALLEAGEFEAARKVAELYEHLALPGQAQVIGARTTELWGQALLEQSQQEGPDSTRLAEARTRFREAAAAFEAAASHAETPASQAEGLWLSAGLFLQGQDPTGALRVLERCVTFPGSSAEQLGQAWYAMAEAYRALDNAPAADAALRQCIKYASPHAYKARYQIALAHLDKQELDAAEEVLQQNLELMQADADPEAQEKSLCTLADLLVQRGNYPLAVVRLRQALERFPDNPHSLRRRFQLARCCQKLAEQEQKRLQVDEPRSAEAQSHYDRQARQWREEAAQNYLQVIDELAARPEDQPLNPDEEGLSRFAAFAYADCRFAQKEDSEAFRIYESLAARYHHQVDGLIALRNLYYCRTFRKHVKEAGQIYQRAQLMVQEMDDAAFDGANEARTRDWWKKWLDRAREEYAQLSGTPMP